LVRFLDVILHRCVNWLAGEDGSRSCLCMLDSNRSRAVDGVLFARSVCVCVVSLPHGLLRIVKCDIRCFMMVLLGKATPCSAYC
jgi:hypothetical protein